MSIWMRLLPLLWQWTKRRDIVSDIARLALIAIQRQADQARRSG